MKVLLIQSNLEKTRPVIVPIGLCYIATVLKNKGIDVDIYDPNLSEKDIFEEIDDVLSLKNYDFIGVSVRNIDNNEMRDPRYYYAELRKLLDKIHEHLPDAKIMIGGTGFSIFAEIIMKRHPLLDYGVYLEGMETIDDLFDNLDHPEKVKGLYYRKDGKIVFTGHREYQDLDNLPSDPWQQVEMEDYSKYPFPVGIISKMGCVFECSHCVYPQLSGRHFSVRSPKLIVDDVELLVSKYGIRQIHFIASIFNYPVKHAIEVCREIIKRGIKIEWGSYFLGKYFTEEFMKIGIESGCSNFTFSPDGIDDATMCALGKVNREEDLHRVVKMIVRCDGARATFSFFLNPPKQSFSGFLKLLKFYINTRLLHPRKFRSVSLWYPRVYPKTPLHDYVTKTGGFLRSVEELLPEDSEGFRRVFWVNSENRYLNFLYNFVVVRGIIKRYIRKMRMKYL